MATRKAAAAPQAAVDFAHTGPGTLAGRYLRRFWQPVYMADEPPAGHAKPIQVMSEDFTLYRGEDGTPHVVAPDRKSTRLKSSHAKISYAVFCLKKKNNHYPHLSIPSPTGNYSPAHTFISYVYVPPTAS